MQGNPALRSEARPGRPLPVLAQTPARPQARSLYRLPGLPVLQNRVYDTPDQALACPRGVMDLIQDMDTGLIRNAAFDPSLLVYDENYQNEQAVSQVFRDHLDAVAGIVADCFGDVSLVEIGCGKGRFLELLRSRGMRVTGIDPAYEGTAPDVIRAPFSPGLGIRAQGVILRHVLEHIPDPVGFLQGVAAANGGGGLVYIEVPCLDWIARHRAFFDIYYEHVNYFRLEDLTALFGAVRASGRLFGGQYLYVAADLASLRRPRRRPGDEFSLPGDFLAAVNRSARLLAGRGGRRAAVWGGSSKGVVFSLLMRQRGLGIDHVIDINPAKQGRHLAATGLKVDAPESVLLSLREGDLIFVMNSNYYDEIREFSGPGFQYVRIDND